MKKVLAALAALAIAGLSSMAFAADVSVGGSVDIRSRWFDNLDMNDDAADNAGSRQVDTQTRVRVDVNVKAGDVKGKVTFENDWDTWGKFEQVQGTQSVVTGPSLTSTGRASRIGLREAWLLTPIPVLPNVYLKGGHMLLQLGQGWFFRSQKFGSDAWVVFTDIDKLHLGAVNVKVSEGATNINGDDADAYVLVGTYKFENALVGIDITEFNNRRGGPGGAQVELQNIGLNFAGKLGPVNLKAEADIQMGEVENGNDFAGNQIIVQGSMPIDPITINFTLARGSGDDDPNDDSNDAIVTLLDADPHYTFLYEYKIAGACGGINQGFCNTTAVSVGASFALSKNLSVGADVWYLMATEDVDNKVGTGTTDKLGTEIDAKINWKLADNVTWGWSLGWLMPDDGLGDDDAMGVQGILSMKF